MKVERGNIYNSKRNFKKIKDEPNRILQDLYAEINKTTEQYNRRYRLIEIYPTYIDRNIQCCQNVNFPPSYLHI